MNIKLPRIIKTLKHERVANMIELLISTHPEGIKILLGQTNPPTPEEIHEMMNAQRLPLPCDYKPATKSTTTHAELVMYDREYFEATVSMCDGWEHIHEVANEFKQIDGRMWGVVADHVRLIGSNTPRYKSKLERIAYIYKISVNTVIKYRKRFSDLLAFMILVPDMQKSFLASEK